MTAAKEVIECNIPSCSKLFRGTRQQAEGHGWRGIKETTSPEPDERYGRKPTGRTMLGWCPNCVVKYSVEGGTT